MRINFKHIKVFTTFTLFVIIINQGLWIYNMYNSYQYEFYLSINKSLENAVFREVSDRGEKDGGFVNYSMLLNSQDSSRFIQKRIVTSDTSFYVQIDRHDPYSALKIVQFILKDNLPLDINKLDSIFRRELLKEKYPVQKTYVEYLDLKMNKVLSTTNSDKNLISSVSSSIFPIDISNSLGVKAYVESPVFIILEMMIFQLMLSSVLIVVCVFCLFYLTKTIFIQRKEEKMRQDSVNVMTHEFKRPISSAIAQTALIPYYLEKNNYDKVQKYSENTLLELNKLTAYTERIQRISNNKEDCIILNKANIDVKVFFGSLTERYLHSEEKQVEMYLEISSSQTHIYADLVHFSNVVENLIENSIKYSKEKVVIFIYVEDENNTLKISIKDNGIGISKMDMNYIFEKFYRSKNKATDNTVGFGLGLTYVKAIVEAHKGKIKVNSELGAGSLFIIYLPIE